MAGIVGYGTYIPKYRIKLAEIAEMWQKNPEEMIAGIKVAEKSVPGLDEDSITVGIEAAKKAFDMAQINPTDIGSVYVGSESHPYVVNPSSSIIAEYLGFGNDYFA